MGNLSKAYFFDAGKNPPRTRRVVAADGERRLERIPNGAVERWVNSHGSVVFHQMLQPGEVPRQDTIDRRRGERRRARPKGPEHELKGPEQMIWIEWGRCPCLQGTISLAYFPPELRELCPHDFRPRGDQACPHVEYVIKVRQATYAEEQKVKHAAMHARDAERSRAVASQEALNKNIARLVERSLANAAPDLEPEKRKKP